MDKPLSVYLHIPFCLKKCAYCDFYSTGANSQQIEAYIGALKKEIKKWGGRTDRPIDTIYFGGGTPSVLDIKQVKDILNSVFDSFNVQRGCEITFEVNPATVNKEYLKELKEIGVNRLSIGIQSGDDAVLKLLGRQHSVQDGINCFNDARKVGFDNISVDLMLGIPNSTTAQTRKSLELIKELSPEHISAYMLILEENTYFYKKRNELVFPDEDAEEKEYMLVCEELKKAGYEHYEISNFCKNGNHSRHNTRYWLCGEYLGLGPSAYSYFEGKRFHYSRDLKGFISAPQTVFDEKGGSLEEFIMLALRLSRGIIKAELENKYGKTFSSSLIKKAEFLKQLNLVNFDKESLSLTEKGMLISNSIITELISEDFYEDI